MDPKLSAQKLLGEQSHPLDLHSWRRVRVEQSLCLALVAGSSAAMHLPEALAVGTATAVVGVLRSQHKPHKQGEEENRQGIQ